jgi:hypothetical protein
MHEGPVADRAEQQLSWRQFPPNRRGSGIRRIPWLILRTLIRTYDLPVSMSIGRAPMLTLGALGLAVYLVVVDLGVSAGRIHHGVEVAGLHLGGMTRGEAAKQLRARVQLMRRTPVVFHAPGITISLQPRDVSWRPQAERTAYDAIRVGREDAPFGALAARFRGWFEGVKLHWTGHAAAAKVSAYIDRVERQVAELGFGLNRGRFRYKVKRGLRAWPRRPLRIPVITEQGSA